MASGWYCCLSIQVECFGTLRYIKMQVPFLCFWWYNVILCHFFFKFFWFFDRLLIFLRYKHDFGYLGLMLVCFITGGGLGRFYRMRYDIFPRVSIFVTTHVTILLWEFCTVSNALLLLAHYCISRCMSYCTFLSWNKYIFVWFSTLYHALPSNFFRKKYIKIYIKNWW